MGFGLVVGGVLRSFCQGLGRDSWLARILFGFCCGLGLGFVCWLVTSSLVLLEFGFWLGLRSRLCVGVGLGFGFRFDS